MDSLAGVNGEHIRPGKLMGQKTADDFAAIHAHNGVDGDVVGIVLGEFLSRCFRHQMVVLHLGDINVVIDVGVASGKVAVGN